MTQYKVLLLAEAQQQFLSILNYIKNVLHSPQAAQNFKKAVHQKLDPLEKGPHIYAYHPGSTKYRKIAIKNYIAIFYIDESTNTVYVTAIVFGGTDYITRYIKGR